MQKQEQKASPYLCWWRWRATTHVRIVLQTKPEEMYIMFYLEKEYEGKPIKKNKMLDKVEQ